MNVSLRSRLSTIFGLAGAFVGLLALHYPLLDLPYFWDEAGYYIPAALDFHHSWLLIPQSTMPTGHTPLVMVYLGLTWRALGFSPLVTRAAMILVAAATVVTLYALARRVAAREVAVWSAALLALSPMFFAQSSLVYLDLPAALFTLLAALALVDGRMVMFATVASLAVLTKETAGVLLPVAWLYSWKRSRLRQARTSLKTWLALAIPLAPLAAWTLSYHHVTGFWTGNAEYLQYNLYSTLDPGRIFWSLLRRLYELFIGGFNWLLVAGAVLAIWRGQTSQGETEAQKRFRDLLFLAMGLGTVYVLMLSVVGGAILPRYLLPIFPLFFLVASVLVWRLPKIVARSLCGATLACFVGAWFINPPYPFPYEDNLSYADFIRLHQQAAQFLELRLAHERILTAWPATDELTRPYLGYVHESRKVVPLQGLSSRDFENVAAESFDVLYLYSRKYEPPGNWLARFPCFQHVQQRYFDYAPQISEEALLSRFRLRLIAAFERRGQWVRIYRK